MDPAVILSRLEALGTAQNRKVYQRHGVRPPLYGVSYANLGKVQKQIGTDHALARALWSTGNHDARILATQIADPDMMTPTAIDQWARTLDNYVVTDALSALVARTPFARKKMEKWIGAPGEWVASAGWNLVARLAMDDPTLPDSYFKPLVAVIEDGIHARKNRVRHAMNQALIAIGVRSKALEILALAAAKRIGTVEVDHGETGCKTPDAAAYIRRTVSRRKTRKAARPSRRR